MLFCFRNVIVMSIAFERDVPIGTVTAKRLEWPFQNDVDNTKLAMHAIKGTHFFDVGY